MVNVIKTKIVITGDKSAIRRLQVAKLRIKNRIPVNKAVSAWLYRWVDKNFRSEGGKVGGWKPFKLGGRWVGKGKNRRFDTSAKLLQDTGVLRGRVKSQYRSMEPFYGQNFAGIGSDVPYAIYHELGVPKRNLPKRRMLPLDTDEDVVIAIRRIYDAYVSRAVR